jgi:transposase
VASSGLDAVQNTGAGADGLPVGALPRGDAGIDAKEREVHRKLENMISMKLPIGVGALSWITLELEIRGWDRFLNRRQIASYTGLCPGIHNSNGRGREDSINRCGNSVVRYTRGHC